MQKDNCCIINTAIQAALDFEKIVKKTEVKEMAANKYAGTKTEKNLMEAFAGESQARNKYTYFASVAKKEGYEQKVRITNGQICKKALPKRLKRKAFQSLQQNSGL